MLFMIYKIIEFLQEISAGKLKITNEKYLSQFQSQHAILAFQIDVFKNVIRKKFCTKQSMKTELVLSNVKSYFEVSSIAKVMWIQYRFKTCGR